MELRHVRTHRSHDPGNLVTKHRRRRDDIVSSKQQVGVAQARCLHIDENFASYRRGDLNVLEIESSTDRIEYKGLHSRFLSRLERLRLHTALMTVAPAGTA